jgi:spermidine synthase
LSRVSPQGDPAGPRWALIYVGVLLTALATLLVELTLTRIFSVVFYYHFAFLAISIAMFGLGVGGVLSYLFAGSPGAVLRRLGALCSANALVVVGSLAFLLSRPGELGNLQLAAVYLASALPFVVAGIVLSLAISEGAARVHRLYFFDLVGAAGGCLLFLALVDGLGGPNTIISAGVLFASASAVWFTAARAPRGRIVAVGVALALVGTVAYNAKYRSIDIRVSKGTPVNDERFVKWNSFSRIAISPDRNSGRRLEIVIDGDASTGIFPYDIDKLDAAQRSAMLGQGPGLPYALRPGAKTLVIGPGGGWDVARALASGSRNITGVEINPIIANTIMRDRFSYLSRGLYRRPEVHIELADGRSFIRRSPDRFQVIQATLVDTWASTAAGAFALSENNLYTTEAFYEYLSHLTDDGVLAFTRWGFDPPRESLRLITLATDALEKLGEKEVWRHFIVARENTAIIAAWGATDTVLISRKPWSDADLARANQIFTASHIQQVYTPGTTGNPFAEFLRGDRNRFYATYRYDVTPVSDDRPFFFYTVQARDVLSYLSLANRDSADFKTNSAVPMLVRLVALSLLGTLLILALPPLLLGTRLPVEAGVRGFLPYFLFIGVGYILIQVALIQRFVLFLGHPTYALTVVIFTMLVASGLGSNFSKRLGAAALWAPAFVAFLVMLLAVLSPAVTDAAMGQPLPIRILISVLLIAPIAALMGVPFPTGLSRLEARHAPSVRWAWSLNAASSVLGSTGAIFLGLHFGLQATLFFGGVLYILAILTSSRAQAQGI